MIIEINNAIGLLVVILIVGILLPKKKRKEFRKMINGFWKLF